VSDPQSRNAGGPPLAVDALLADGALGRALLEQSPFSTVVYAPDGRPVYSNPAFERYWNTSLADVPPSYSVLEDVQLADQGMMPQVRRAFAGETVSLPAVRYDMNLVTGVSDRIQVLDEGLTLYEGDPKAAFKDKAVVDAYLGES